MPEATRYIEYSGFDKPVKIIKGDHQSEFAYGPNRERYLRIDANSDGVLNRSELNALVGEKKAEFMMGDLDVDHDGKIDPSEWSTYWVKCSSAGVNVDKRLNWIEQQVVSLEQGRAASKKKASLRCCSATDIPEIMKRATFVGGYECT